MKERSTRKKSSVFFKTFLKQHFKREIELIGNQNEGNFSKIRVLFSIYKKGHG